MKKKYLVRDGETEYEVTEETIDEDVTENEEEIIETKDDDESSLTADEISALKSLAAVAPKLLEMIEAKTTDEDEDDNLVTCDEDEDETDVEIDCDDEEIEEIEEEVEKKPTHDSKRSFGAIERKQRTHADDAMTDEISDAWAKRYGGNK